MFSLAEPQDLYTWWIQVSLHQTVVPNVERPLRSATDRSQKHSNLHIFPGQDSSALVGGTRAGLWKIGQNLRAAGSPGCTGAGTGSTKRTLSCAVSYTHLTLPTILLV
eukprot:5252252-Amphidinium_carterae.1